MQSQQKVILSIGQKAQKRLTKIYTSNACEWVAERFMREYNKKAAKNREICLIHLLPINTTPSQVDSWERNIRGRYIMKILILIKSVVSASEKNIGRSTLQLRRGYQPLTWFVADTFFLESGPEWFMELYVLWVIRVHTFWNHSGLFRCLRFWGKGVDRGGICCT